MSKDVAPEQYKTRPIKTYPGRAGKNTAFELAKVIEIKPEGKYLLIFPKDAKIELISKAIGSFFEPAKFFVLAVNDINEVKIAELLEEK